MELAEVHSRGSRQQQRGCWVRMMRQRRQGIVQRERHLIHHSYLHHHLLEQLWMGCMAST
jgi:hypothetical protein